MGSPVVSPEDVLESLMNDGTIDTIRLKIINQLKANEELKNYTISMVEQSKVLNTPGAEKQTKRELFDALRQELESSVLEKASKAVWELILDNNNLGKEISETVERVFWRLSGREPPVAAPNGDAQEESDGKEKGGGEKDKEKEKEEITDLLGRKRTVAEINMQGKEREGVSDSSQRKRSFSVLNMQGADIMVNGPSDAPSVTEDSAVLPSQSRDMKSD
uniref:DNA-directed RNA polymerase subunit beta n=1 Tax=Anthurium amnicola TaxID=1678845 RepID=A0A1D1YD17_9ARAE